MQTIVLVGIGGALGAIARYGVSSAIARLTGLTFPLGTMFVNISGSLLMGILVGLLARFTPVWSNEARLFLAIGVLGGFTTLSSFSLDVVTLVERGEMTSALTYALLSVVVSVAALYFGLLVTRGSLA